jgi:formylmethanofuran dehydrogenase subunit E
MIACLPDLAALLERSAALHQHLCPRQVLGVRCGMYAAELFDLDLPQQDKRLLAFVETDGCFADGIAVTTGCRLGRRTLRLMDEGKVAVTFVDTYTNEAIRIAPHPLARDQAARYAPDAPDRWHAYLEGYQVMPTEELLCARAVTLTISLERLISRAGIRTVCAQCSEEIINEREVRRGGRLVCRSCAGERYYVVS